MKLVILDAYAENPGDLSWDWLKNVVDEYEIYDITPPEKIVERSIDADILVIWNHLDVIDMILRSL